MIKSLNVVSASFFQPIVEQFRHAGASPERLAESVGLSVHAVESPSSYLPRHAAQRFAIVLSRYAGNGLLFYDHSAQGIAPLLARASASVLGRGPTPFEQLSRFFALAAHAASSVRFVPRVDGPRLLIQRIDPEPKHRESWQFEQYAVGALEAVASSILGPRARPVSIRLRSSRPAHDLPPQWQGPALSFGQRHTEIGFPVAALVKGANGNRNQFGDHDFVDGPASPNLGRALLEYAAIPNAGIDQVAEAFGMNRRTFQRRLSAIGHTYTTLVEEARFQDAIRLLEVPGTRIFDAAIGSGYCNGENFARAFRRRYGMPPSQYRRLQRL